MESGSDSDRESDEDKVMELPAAQEQKPPAVKKGPRSSVSAEAFGSWNKKAEFKPPKHEKTLAVHEALKKRLS